MKTKTLILICGLPESGKTRLRLALEPLFAGADTSDSIIDAAASVMRCTRDEVIRSKNQLRPLLVAIGDAWVSENPTALVDRAMEKTLFRNPNIAIAGVRRASELDAVREKYGFSGTDVTAIWVDRPGK